jgi:hypothetical protein
MSKNDVKPEVEDLQKRKRAGAFASRSPLTALARMNPALCALGHNPFPDLDSPRFHAVEIRARPTNNQYATAKPTVLHNMMLAFP